MGVWSKEARLGVHPFNGPKAFDIMTFLRSTN